MLKRLLNLLSLLLIQIFTPYKAVLVPKVNYFAMSPLNLTNKTTYIKVGISNFNSEITVHGNIYLINDLYTSGVNILSFEKRTSGGIETFTYDNKYTRTNNQIRIEIYIGATVFEATKSVSVSKSSTTAIKNSGQTINDTYPCLIYDGEWREEVSNYVFNGFDSIYVPSFYHNFDLSNYKIASSSPFPIDGGNNFLYLFNRDGVFDDMPVKSKYLEVPIKINNEGELELKEEYYVDPVTLLMSKDKKEGYIKTRHIYFPCNEMRYQDEYDGRMLFNDFGNTHSKVTYQFKINALKNIMGDCYNSEYCIISKNVEVDENLL